MNGVVVLESGTKLPEGAKVTKQTALVALAMDSLVLISESSEGEEWRDVVAFLPL